MMLSRLIPKNTPALNWIMGSGFSLIALLLISFGFQVMKIESDFIESASHASGIVVRRGSVWHRVVVRFNTAKGEVVEFDQSDVTYMDIGEKVTVLYDPKNPRLHPRRDSFSSTRFSSSTLFCMASFMLFMSGLAVFKPGSVNI